MASIWDSSKPRKKSAKTKPTGYEGNTKQLLDLSQTYASPRALRAMRVQAEINRSKKNGALPTVEEIQLRQNLTEKAAISFIGSMKRAIKQSASPVPKPVISTMPPIAAALLIDQIEKSPAEILPPEDPQFEAISLSDLAELPVTPPAFSPASNASNLHESLQKIRSRYGDEIRIRGEQTTVKEGFIYIVVHPSFAGWVKAGMTIDYEMRLGVYNVCDPLSRFEFTALKWVPDRRQAERDLLISLNGCATEMRGEWVKLDPIVANEILKLI